MNENKLKYDWEKLCNEYVKIFCEKHDICYDDDDYIWVGGSVGEIANIGDFYIDFSVIRYDIDNNIEESKFEKWYWKSLDVYQITGDNYLSYESFCRGAPDKWSDEKLEEIKKLQQNAEYAKQLLEDEIIKLKNEIKK